MEKGGEDDPELADILGGQDDFHWHKLAYIKIQGRKFKEEKLLQK